MKTPSFLTPPPPQAGGSQHRGQGGCPGATSATLKGPALGFLLSQRHLEILSHF